ncbi:hypothetical protein OIU78_013951 [Salix suchowensis]|nr:hypothetical protein OIU78_013951 [Salix suchowensis]
MKSATLAATAINLITLSALIFLRLSFASSESPSFEEIKSLLSASTPSFIMIRSAIMKNT